MHRSRHTSPALIADALELAELVRTRAPWAPRLEELHATPGVYMLAGDDDGGTGSEKDGGRNDDTDRSRDDDRDDDRRDDRDKDRDRDRDKDKDDDGVDPDLAASRKAAERYRKERDDLKREQAQRERDANEKSGKFEELYSTERKRADDLELELNTFKATTYAERALQAAGARSPQRAARMLDLKSIESEDDAEREVRALKRDDPELFKSGRRQTRTRDDDDRDSDRDRDDDRDQDRDDTRRRGRDRDDDRPAKLLGPERMRRHFEDKDRDRDRDRSRR